MIAGEVTADRVAILQLQTFGPGGAEAGVDAALDTGFTENLTLPPAVIANLRLPYRGVADFIVADGVPVRLRLFAASVLWHGQRVRLLVVEADGGALVGMSLLHGNRVTLDVVDGGHVTIEPLP